MTTIVNGTNPAPENSGNGLLIGILVFIVFLGVVLYFGTPVFNRTEPAEVSNVPTTQVNVETPQVVVPDKIDVVPAE